MRYFIEVKKWILEKPTLEMQEYAMSLQLYDETDQTVILEALSGIDRETEKAILVKASAETCHGRFAQWYIWIPKSQIVKIKHENPV